MFTRHPANFSCPAGKAGLAGRLGWLCLLGAHMHTEAHAWLCTCMRTHFHMLVTYARTQASGTPTRGVSCPCINIKHSSIKAQCPGPSRPARGTWGLTSVIWGLEHLTLWLDQSSQGLEGPLQCCWRVHLRSPLHQPHANFRSALRQRPQLSRWAAHL